MSYTLRTLFPPSSCLFPRLPRCFHTFPGVRCAASWGTRAAAWRAAGGWRRCSRAGDAPFVPLWLWPTGARCRVAAAAGSAGAAGGWFFAAVDWTPSAWRWRGCVYLLGGCPLTGRSTTSPDGLGCVQARWAYDGPRGGGWPRAPGWSRRWSCGCRAAPRPWRCRAVRLWRGRHRLPGPARRELTELLADASRSGSARTGRRLHAALDIEAPLTTSCRHAVLSGRPPPTRAPGEGPIGTCARRRRPDLYRHPLYATAQIASCDRCVRCFTAAQLVLSAAGSPPYTSVSHTAAAPPASPNTPLPSAVQRHPQLTRPACTHRSRQPPSLTPSALIPLRHLPPPPITPRQTLPPPPPPPTHPPPHSPPKHTPNQNPPTPNYHT